jgi:hypothetical protein
LASGKRWNIIQALNWWCGPQKLSGDLQDSEILVVPAFVLANKDLAVRVDKVEQQ